MKKKVESLWNNYTYIHTYLHMCVAPCANFFAIINYISQAKRIALIDTLKHTHN